MGNIDRKTSVKRVADGAEGSGFDRGGRDGPAMTEATLRVR